MGACKAVCAFFPSCQVRVVRFYVSCPAFSFFSSSSSAGPQLQALDRSVPAGPQPQRISEDMPDRMLEKKVRKLYHIYFQMICQKLCQIKAFAFRMVSGNASYCSSNAVKTEQQQLGEPGLGNLILRQTRLQTDILWYTVYSSPQQDRTVTLFRNLLLSLSLWRATYTHIYKYKLRRFKIETCPFDLVGWFTVYLWQIIFPNYIDYQMVFWISDFLQHNKDWSWTTAAASSDDRWSVG